MRGRPKLIAVSEDEPLVWVERCPSRLAAIRAGAEECCGNARHFWARRRYMREATIERDCPIWPHGADEDGDPPDECRCWQIEEGYWHECSANDPDAFPVWRVSERPRRWRRWVRRQVGRVLYRRRSYDGRRSVLWGGKVQRKATRLDRWLGAPGYYLLGDTWVRPEPIRWLYCDVCGCSTPRRIGAKPPRCLAADHFDRKYPATPTTEGER